MIATLVERSTRLSPELRTIFERVFAVQTTVGYTAPPASMEPWIEQQFGTRADVAQQTIVRVSNRLTGEETLFNPLRARRPASAAGDDAALEAWIAAELAKPDMFRSPATATTADVFGRIRGRSCVTAANVAKYEGWHGLVIFDEPHPLRWTNDQVSDYLDTAQRWMHAAHAADPAAIYPLMTWNCLPKSGATLMHGHMQMALTHARAYRAVALWQHAAQTYRAMWNRSYFDDLWALHAALDVGTFVAPQVRAFASLTPQRNREIVLLAPAAAGESQPLEALASGLFRVLRGLVETQGVRAFNVAVVLPPLGEPLEPWADVPLFARVVDRGDAMSRHSDVGAMELFATGCVVADPFLVAKAMWHDTSS